MSEALVIKSYLGVQQFGADLHIGAQPPRALVVRDAPPFLAELLEYLSEPRDHASVHAWAAARDDAPADAVDLALGQLAGLDVLGTEVIPQDRYGRHRLYFDLLGEQHQKVQEGISGSTVVLIGVGGIGTNVATSLAGAGIGRLVLADHDVVEETNLTRQFLFTQADVGRAKVDAAREALGDRNPNVDVSEWQHPLSSPEDAVELVEGADFVVVSADTPSELVEWVNAACCRSGVPYSHAGYIESHGVVGPLVIPGESACHECLRRDGDLDAYGATAEEAARQYNRAFQAPSYGPLNQLVAAVQSNEILRHLGGIGASTRGRRLLFDARDYAVVEEVFTREPECPVCGDRARAGAVA